ncbi:MAG: hypothetical protein RL095_2356 [Verrucomicrobiota bacterium]|jgi:hypothetical protein
MQILLFILGIAFYSAGVYFALFLNTDLYFRPPADQQSVQYQIYGAYFGILLGMIMAFWGYLKGTAVKTN